MIDIDPKKFRDPLILAKYSVVFFFLLLQVYLIFWKQHETLDLDIYPNTVPTPLIYGERTVGQTFIAESDNLCRVDIMMGTLGRQNDSRLTFRLHGLDENAADVRTTTVKAAGLLNNLYNPFIFEPVRRSRKRTFMFSLSSPGAGPENSVCVWMNDKNIYRLGTALINRSPVRGDLVFRVYAKRPIVTELHRIVKKNPGILGQAWFFVLCACLFEGFSVLMLIRLLDLLILALKKQD